MDNGKMAFIYDQLENVLSTAVSAKLFAVIYVPTFQMVVWNNVYNKTAITKCEWNNTTNTKWLAGYI